MSNCSPRTKPGQSRLHDMSEITIKLPESFTISDLASVSSDWATDFDMPLIIDAEDVVMIDSAGLQLLLSYCREYLGRGHGISWSGVSDRFSEVARMLGMTSALGLES